MTFLDDLDDAFDNSEFYHLCRAVKLGAAQGWDFALEDIDYVEAIWRLLDCDAVSFGVIAHVQGHRRVYFDYTTYPGEDGMVERVTFKPMGDELYPKLEGAIPGWHRDVDALNGRFAH
jgi:hypothetical protein